MARKRLASGDSHKTNLPVLTKHAAPHQVDANLSLTTWHSFVGSQVLRGSGLMVQKEYLVVLIGIAAPQ